MMASPPDEWTDGDSFRVRLPDGRLQTFRLYFVDISNQLVPVSATLYLTALGPVGVARLLPSKAVLRS
jgi:hypothetical protein